MALNKYLYENIHYMGLKQATKTLEGLLNYEAFRGIFMFIYLYFRKIL